VITPRVTRLLRVPDLRALHRAVAECLASADPLAARSQAVIVPTRGAGEWLRRTLETLSLERGAAAALILPEILTRQDFYSQLHQRLPGAPPLLSEFEREVLLRRAARAAAERGAPAPFSLRPGLIVEILGFYDELRRRHRTVGDFSRLITDSLAGSVEIDRGAERMQRQTRFLTAAFEEFERSVGAGGAIDEHRLRALLIETDAPPAFGHVVVAVADQPADPLGLWTADYDLLARLPGVQTIDVLATEALLAAGFHTRVHDLLPGIVEERRSDASPPPVLLAPEARPESPAVHWYTSRDREEELADVVRRVMTGAATGRVGVVFQRPLPYLYLARHVFADSLLTYEAMDALPLAAEPFAAALDLIFTCVGAEATRASLVELLRSPHWDFASLSGGEPLALHEIAALDGFLQRSKYLGGWGRLAALAGPRDGEPDAPKHSRGRIRADRALAAAVALAARLQTLSQPAGASTGIHALLAFVEEFERLPDAAQPWYAPHMRARAAILDALRRLAIAHARHDDAAVDPGELAATVRRWMEGQTFSPRTGTAGAALLDAAAATCADIDEVCLVGLVESDWPERTRRSIFYPANLLTQLGWPAEADRLAAARARFQDLLRLAHQRVSLSTFTLENDTIVSPSAFLDEVPASGLSLERRTFSKAARVFVHEALSELPVVTEAVAGSAAEWLELRRSRTDLDGDRHRGFAGRQHVSPHAVSHLERYLECPFKYFAQHVLSLEEERDDESVLTPQERGHLLHEVFERFFAAWHAAGNGGITPANLPAALALFEEIAEARLSALSEADRSLERTYLLGSAVAAGLAERAFAFEIDHQTPVLERLLEYPLAGEFEFAAGGRSRRIAIRAKVDRIDLLEDGTLRIIDYKLGRAPRPARALQLPIYGVSAAQHLEGRHGRHWTVSRAGYIAFREKRAFTALGGSSSLAAALEAGQERLMETVDRIERGEFPVDPDEPFLCTRCAYASVCRKDYVGDE